MPHRERVPLRAGGAAHRPPDGRVLPLSRARACANLAGPLPVGGGESDPHRQGRGFQGPSPVPAPLLDPLWHLGLAPGHPGHLLMEEGMGGHEQGWRPGPLEG